MNRDSTRAESGAQKCQSKVIFFWFWYRRRCGDGLQPQELLLYKTRLEGIIVKERAMYQLQIQSQQMCV